MTTLSTVWQMVKRAQCKWPGSGNYPGLGPGVITIEIDMYNVRNSVTNAGVYG